MSGCSCEDYTHEGDCDYCKGFTHAKEHILELIDEIERTECHGDMKCYCDSGLVVDVRELKGRIEG